MKYDEILPDVLAGKWVRFTIVSDCNETYGWGPWIKMTKEGHFITKSKEKYTPSMRAYASDKWEVKQDQEEGFYIWGTQLVVTSPEKKHRNVISLTESLVVDGATILFHTDHQIFPDLKPQKYKLVPVKED